jgi:hypothetical protein
LPQNQRSGFLKAQGVDEVKLFSNDFASAMVSSSTDQLMRSAAQSAFILRGNRLTAPRPEAWRPGALPLTLGVELAIILSAMVSSHVMRLRRLSDD